MSLLAGAAEADITPPFPVDLLGYVRRPLAARSAYEPLLATACVFRDEDSGETVVVIGADVVGLTTPMADRIRARVGELVGCDPAAVLLNASHSHAAPWPGATIKLGGEFDEWTETELRYWDSMPDRYASVALEAVGRLAPARVSGGVGVAPGLAVNRRERTADGRAMLGWHREGVRDDSVVAIRVDGLDDAPLVPTEIATLVSFACHPVVIGPDVEGAGPDFVGPLRARLSNLLRPGSITVFLQGAAGDALPLESFLDDRGTALVTAEVVGERIAL
jgi:neutral ceramidase